VVRSVPTDALLRPLMHRSDNFFAEQALLMVSRRLTGVFNESAAIDTLLATTFAGLPQPPRWADGSGLSRYNLFTPEDFIWVLDRMRVDVGMDRLSYLLPTAGTGTLGSLDRRLEGRVIAKTGTLSGVVALSGYLRTRRERWLLFSLLVNNHRTTAAAVRKRFEAFLLDLYERG
jgi:D-alanyl-D-alanine carboxypeptidase/D-alanyl-D-alanine-endopeptidase (penicillin-binding protein 4)